jgi:hypothetical protein
VIGSAEITATSIIKRMRYGMGSQYEWSVTTFLANGPKSVCGSEVRRYHLIASEDSGGRIR